MRKDWKYYCSLKDSQYYYKSSNNLNLNFDIWTHKGFYHEFGWLVSWLMRMSLKHEILLESLTGVMSVFQVGLILSFILLYIKILVLIGLFLWVSLSIIETAATFQEALQYSQMYVTYINLFLFSLNFLF